MNLKMAKIVDNGTHSSEKVLIDVLEDTNLKFYLIRDSTYSSEETLSNKWVHTYKFLNQKVKKGDKVILFTKHGKKLTRDLGNGNTEYTYHWGLDNSVWNNDGDVAILYQIKAWDSIPVNQK